MTANTCFGTAGHARTHGDPFFAGLATRKDKEEIKHRGRTALQAKADALDAVTATTAIAQHVAHTNHALVDPNLALV